VFLADPVSFDVRARLIEFAAILRLPAIYQQRNWAEDGGVMSSGIDRASHQPQNRPRLTLPPSLLLRADQVIE
jgi:hypothetical protein